MVVGGEPYERRSKEGASFEVEGPTAFLFGDGQRAGARVARRHRAEIDRGERDLEVRVNDLHRLPVAHREGRAEGVVPSHHGPQSADEGLPVERAPDAPAARHVVRGRAALQLLE